MHDNASIFELFPPLVIVAVVVGIAWLVFPFIVMGRLKTMIQVMENSLAQLHHIGNLIGQIRIPAELIPPPPPPVETPPKVNTTWATCLGAFAE
jgi:hypothetical protein